MKLVIHGEEIAASFLMPFIFDNKMRTIDTDQQQLIKGNHADYNKIITK